MTDHQFKLLVEDMRAAQIAFFKSRTGFDFASARELEKACDCEISAEKKRRYDLEQQLALQWDWHPTKEG